MCVCSIFHLQEFWNWSFPLLEYFIYCKIIFKGKKQNKTLFEERIILNFKYLRRESRLASNYFSQVLSCNGLIRLLHLEAESERRNYLTNLKVDAMGKINKVYRRKNHSWFVGITFFTDRQGFLRTFLIS